MMDFTGLGLPQLYFKNVKMRIKSIHRESLINDATTGHATRKVNRHFSEMLRNRINGEKKVY